MRKEGRGNRQIFRRIVTSPSGKTEVKDPVVEGGREASGRRGGAWTGSRCGTGMQVNCEVGRDAKEWRDEGDRGGVDFDGKFGVGK